MHVHELGHLLRLTNTSIDWLCKACNTPNHSSVLYISIMSDDNQLRSLNGNETNNVNIDNLFSLNNSISSSPKQHNTSVTTRASKDTLHILNINFQSIRNKKALLHNLVETTETDIIIGTEIGSTIRSILLRSYQQISIIYSEMTEKDPKEAVSSLRSTIVSSAQNFSRVTTQNL